MKKVLLATAALLVFSSLSQAQMLKGAWGISPGVAFGPTTADIAFHTNTVIGLAYAIERDLRFDLGVAYFTEEHMETDMGIGAALSYYVWKLGDMNTFVSGGLGWGTTAPVGDITSSQFGGSVKFGAEYDFSAHFAVNGTIGGEIIGGNGHTSLATIAGTGATWWFGK